MKSTIHIPAAMRLGRSTASIYCYPYNKATGKTVTTYIGSFRVDINPKLVPFDLELEPGQRKAGITLSANAPFALGPEHAQVIREWLQKNGTFLRLQDIHEAKRAVERNTLKQELREEILRELAIEQQRDRDAQKHVTVGLALVEAEAALLMACNELRSEVEAATSRGQQLTQRRSLNTAVREGMSDLDLLQARANRIRVLALSQFERACQDAGLMLKPQRKRKAQAS